MPVRVDQPPVPLHPDARDQQVRLGPYLLRTRIARGGMGEVFLATERLPRGHERPVVVKRILPHLSDDENFVDMFLREAEIASRLQHENIVQIFQVGSAGGRYYIAMEYIQGKDLRSTLLRASQRGVKLTPEMACHIVACLGRGLHHAHTRAGISGNGPGLVHRDVSPHNILISYEGSVKLIDFGITKAADGVGVTLPGAFKGKIPYMSPEQARAEEVDARSDIFSTGAVLFEMLSGRPLFSGDTDYQVLEQICRVSIEETLGKGWTGAPEGVKEILCRALQRNPADRYGSMLEFQRAVEGFLHERGFRDGPSAVSELMVELFREERERENEALCRTRTFVPDERPAGVLHRLRRKRHRVHWALRIAGREEKRILRHRLVILVLALIIVFEACLFVWRDIQWRRRDQAAGRPVPPPRPPVAVGGR